MWWLVVLCIGTSCPAFEAVYEDASETLCNEQGDAQYAEFKQTWMCVYKAPPGYEVYWE